MSRQKSQLLPEETWGHPTASPRLPGMAPDSLRESYTCLGAIVDESLVRSHAGRGQPAVVCDKFATCLCQSWMIPGLILAQSETSPELIGGNLRQPQAAWDKS